MRDLSKGQFLDRMEREEAINRARKIFINSGVTNNISVAFELYQELIAENERLLQLNTMEHGKGQASWLQNSDKYDRPNCPDCMEPLSLNVIECGRGIKSAGNKRGWCTRWSHDVSTPALGPDATKDQIEYTEDAIAESIKCVYEQYSTKTIPEWEKKLRKNNG